MSITPTKDWKEMTHREKAIQEIASAMMRRDEDRGFEAKNKGGGLLKVETKMGTDEEYRAAAEITLDDQIITMAKNKVLDHMRDRG